MENIQEITECCICTDTFTDPRMLTCIHTFCLKCLEKTASTRELKPGDSMPCPLCRKPFVIPTEGMIGLQKNFFMERFVEISKLPQPSSSVVLCDVCKTEKSAKLKRNEVTTATQLCIQCKQNLCDLCCQDHKKNKKLQHHELIPIGSSLKDILLMKNVSLQLCDQHNEKVLDMFCVDCKKVICTKCFAQKHKTHNCSDIDEISEEFREQIRRDLVKMTRYEAEAGKRVDEIVKLKADFQKKAEDTKRTIIQRGIELKELVDRHTKSLLDELSLINQRVRKEIAIQHEESETHKMIINSFDKYCTEMKNNGSNAEVCRAANYLHLRAEELKTIHEKQIHKHISSTDVKFHASDADDYLKNHNFVGKIQVQVLFRSKGQLTQPCGCSVTGVTKLQNKIYVLCQSPNVIQVFDDQTPYEFEKRVEIMEAKHPWDIESCEILGCLYISDEDNRCVWRINVDDHRVTTVLSEAQIVDPFTLSITSKGDLLVLRKVEELEQVELYGSDGKLVHCIDLPDGIYWPRHAIQKPNGDFLILHRYGASGGPCVISQLINDGQKLITRFNPKDKTQELNGACRLALDSDNNRLFVADFSNNRVIVFDSLCLNLIEVLLTWEANGIIEPCRLHLDKMKKQLIVGHTMDKVEVYEA